MEIFKPTEKTYYAAYSDNAFYIGVTHPGLVTSNREQVFELDTDIRSFAKKLEQKGLVNRLPEIPPERVPVDEDQVYNWNNKAAVAIQSHIRGTGRPDELPDKFRLANV